MISDSMNRIFAFLIVCLSSVTISQAKDYEAGAFGILGDGMVVCTHTIQHAIDKISAKGGGRLIFRPGRYLTGSIVLKSGVELHFEQGATLLGSTNPMDYPRLEVSGEGDCARQDNSKMALILAQDAENIALTGQGCIDGNGLQLALNIDSLIHEGVLTDPHYNTRRNRPNETMRPKLFFFSGCKDVRVTELQLRNSACWGLSFDLCREMVIDGIKFVNRAYWNNDGIDVTDCQQVRISNCNINTADDGICLKSYHADSCCDSILIDNCAIASSACAVKFGTASWGGFKHIKVTNIRVKDTFRSAIAIESVDGGVIDDVLIDGITAINTGNAIFVRLGTRAGQHPSQLRNVVIRNLYCEVPFGRPDIDYDLRGPEVNEFHNPFPSSITGLPEHRVENVLIEHVEIVAPGRATRGMAYVPLSRLSAVPERAEQYPEFSMFGELPAWGFYVRHVNGIRFRDVRLRLKDTDFRPAFVLDDVKDFDFQDVQADGGDNDKNIFIR